MLVYFDFRVGIVVSSCGVLSDFLTHCHRQKKSDQPHITSTFGDFGLSWTSFLTFESQFKKESKQRFYAAEEARGC